MTPPTTGQRAGSAAVVMLLGVALLWVLEVIDQLTGNWLDNFGIRARELDGLPAVFSAPLLHAGWTHLISNSLPFFALGFLVLLGGVVRWLASTLISVVTSGLTAWLLTPVNTIVLGASGLIFGWLTYLLAAAVFGRKPSQVIVAVIVLLAYGSMIWGILPRDSGISWQAHLGGAIGGVLAAWWLQRREVSRPRSYSQYQQ